MKASHESAPVPIEMECRRATLFRAPSSILKLSYLLSGLRAKKARKAGSQIDHRELVANFPWGALARVVNSRVPAQGEEGEAARDLPPEVPPRSVATLEPPL